MVKVEFIKLLIGMMESTLVIGTTCLPSYMSVEGGAAFYATWTSL